MGEQTESTTREALADFLRQRRDALSPEVVGLRGGQRRRTPGLRRDEVARLANMSTTYYERLEQGRGSQPSAAILAGLARGLRLDPDERAYLHLLAGHAEPVAAKPEGAVDPRLLSVMRAVTATFPAFITNDLGTVSAQNALHTTLFDHVVGLPSWEGNLFWCWFGSGRWRRSVLNSPEQQETIGHHFVAYLRMIVAKRGYDVVAAALVAGLRAVSGEFLRMWDEHRVSAFASQRLSLADDRVGRLEFDCALMVDEQSGQRLYSLHPVPGTPTRQRSTRLADLTVGASTSSAG